MGIGQDKLAVTPLQMAMVASAVANDGMLVAPRLTEEVVDPDGRVLDEAHAVHDARDAQGRRPTRWPRMMAQVVNEGSGTAAALSGVEVAGKTGTAEIDPSRNVNTLWFIGFAPIDRPRIAVAVTLERQQGGTGGEVAAPIAKAVLEALLGEAAGDGRAGTAGGGDDDVQSDGRRDGQ